MRGKSEFLFLCFKNDKRGKTSNKIKVGRGCSQAMELKQTRRTSWEVAQAEPDHCGSPNGPQ